MTKRMGQADAPGVIKQLGKGTFRIKEVVNNVVNPVPVAWAYRQNDDPMTPIYWAFCDGFWNLPNPRNPRHGTNKTWVFDSSGVDDCEHPDAFKNWVKVVENNNDITGMTFRISTDATWYVS